MRRSTPTTFKHGSPSAIQSGSGADIILVVNNWPQLYASSVVDVSDVAEQIGNAQGGYYDISKVVANDGQKWIGVPWSIGGGLLTNRKSWFDEVGYSDGKFPETWDEYRAVGGVKRAVAETADAVYRSLPPGDQRRVREAHCGQQGRDDGLEAGGQNDRRLCPRVQRCLKF